MSGRTRKVTLEGDPMSIIRIAETHGFKITHPRWWQRTKQVNVVEHYWLWMVCALSALSFVLRIVGWLGG